VVNMMRLSEPLDRAQLDRVARLALDELPVGHFGSALEVLCELLEVLSILVGFSRTG
jgi:hypothetical protein